MRRRACVTVKLVPVVCAMAAALATPSGARGAAFLAPGQLFEPHAVVEGQPVDQWTQEWWRWALSLSGSPSPFQGNSAAAATRGQSGPVFFLANNLGPATPQTRAFSVPQGKYQYLPLIPSLCANLFGEGNTEAELLATCDEELSTVNGLFAIVDGVAVPDLPSYREQTPAGKTSEIDVESNNPLRAPAGHGPGRRRPAGGTARMARRVFQRDRRLCAAAGGGAAGRVGRRHARGDASRTCGGRSMQERALARPMAPSIWPAQFFRPSHLEAERFVSKTRNGFIPTDGDVLDVLRYASRTGRFAWILGLDLGDGHKLVPTYQSDRFTVAIG